MPGFLAPGADIHLFALVLCCFSVVEGSMVCPGGFSASSSLKYTPEASARIWVSPPRIRASWRIAQLRIQSHLRCLPGSRSLYFLSGGRHFTGVACERECASIYTLQGGVNCYSEKYRMTILGSDVLMKGSPTPAFPVVILDNLCILREAEDRYMNWEEHGFAVAG
jgi:hypothetical protein